jgi:hypothetical protein
MVSAEKKDRMPIYDFIGGAILVIGCAFFSWESVTMPRPASWLTAPGLTPLLIFGSMGFMGGFLFLDGFRRNGWGLLKEEVRGENFKTDILNGIIRNKITGLVFIFFLYYVVLTQILPFEISTFIYLFITFKVFWKRSLPRMVLVAGIVSLVISLVLSEIFNVVLPGVPFRELKFW